MSVFQGLLNSLKTFDLHAAGCAYPVPFDTIYLERCSQTCFKHLCGSKSGVRASSLYTLFLWRARGQLHGARSLQCEYQVLSSRQGQNGLMFSNSARLRYCHDFTNEGIDGHVGYTRSQRLNFFPRNNPTDVFSSLVMPSCFCLCVYLFLIVSIGYFMLE